MKEHITLRSMDSNIAQTILFLKSLPSQFPSSRFNYTRNRMGVSAYSLSERMTHVSSRNDPRAFPPFDGDDLSRCLWWIIDNPAYWKVENFLSVAMLSGAWKGVVVRLVPLIQELMLTPTREEPGLSQWIRQIMNDSIDPPHQNMKEAIDLVGGLTRRPNAALELNPDLPCSILEISLAGAKFSSGDEGEVGLVRRQRRFWEDFQSSPKKLTNDLITISSKHKGRFRIVVSKNPDKEMHVPLDQNGRWTAKIEYAPVIASVAYYGENV